MSLPKACILTVGDELLGGRVVNTNAAFLAGRLTELGYLVVATETVGDEEFAIADAVKGLCARADAVLVVGGLGPTPDDVTREALAGAAGVLLVVDSKLKSVIAKRTKGRALKANLRMARIPEGAGTFANPIGGAAGLKVQIGGTPVYSMPGVPMEMEAIFEDSVVVDLQRTYISAPLPVEILKVFGLREAEVAERLGDLLLRGAEPTVGVTVKYGVVTVTVAGIGAPERAAKIRKSLGNHLFGTGDETLAGVVLRRLEEKGLTLGVAESLTGGMLASFIVDVVGASKVFRGGIVAYATREKHELLGVPKTVLKREGPVSAETALRMARGARKRLEVDVAVATTGVAGPDPDEQGVKVGHGFVAVAGPGRKEKVASHDCGGNRNAIRRRFAWAALDLARRQL
ncbi:MAG: CinA family nicotinamide mononucleotide deamidase-related protein [Planctomycetota bacterium]|jgi:nicotinamide-nucleotide amidase